MPWGGGELIDKLGAAGAAEIVVQAADAALQPCDVDAQVTTAKQWREHVELRGGCDLEAGEEELLEYSEEDNSPSDAAENLTEENSIYIYIYMCSYILYILCLYAYICIYIYMCSYLLFVFASHF